MSAILLIFLSNDGFAGWLHVGEQAIVARGEGLDDLPLPAQPDATRIVAVVPGDAVSLHWISLPDGLSEPQAQAAGRLKAADLTPETNSGTHIAVGPAENGLRCIALVSARSMEDWIRRLQDRGLDPGVVVPETLLLLPPEQDLVRYGERPLPLFRGEQHAFSVEPDLVARAMPDTPIETIDDERFERDLPAAVAAFPVNLRQGAFARRRRWNVDRKQLRRIAFLALSVFLLGIAIQMTAMLRHTFAADGAEREAAALAQSVAPGATPGQLERRLADLGGGARYTRLAAALFEAIRATPNVQLSGLAFTAEDGLRATVAADTPATIAAVQQQIRSGGLAAEASAIRPEGARSVAELTVRTR